MSIVDASKVRSTEPSFVTSAVPELVGHRPGGPDHSSAQINVVQHEIQTVESHRGHLGDKANTSQHRGERYNFQENRRSEQLLDSLQFVRRRIPPFPTWSPSTTLIRLHV